MNIKEYYSKKEIQKELLRLSKDREVQAWFGEIRGRRPEIVNFEGDIKDLINQGMTSFHLSEERWRDPLRLEAGLGKKELDNLRIGWDACVPSYETIFVNDGKNTKLMTFEQLANYLNFTQIGRHKVKGRLWIFSLDTKTFKIRQDVIKDFVVREKKENERVFRFLLNDGKIINTSPDHPILILTEEGIKIKKAKDLSCNDYLVIPLKLDFCRRKQFINLVDLILFYKIELNYKIKYKNTVISEFSVYSSDCLKYLRSLPSTLTNNISKNCLPLNFYFELDPNLNHKDEIFLSMRKNKIKVPTTLKLTREFGRLIGYYLAEGSIDCGRLEFTFNINERKEVREVVDLMNLVFKTNFNYRIIVPSYSKEQSAKVRFNSKILSIIFGRILGFMHETGEKQIPDWVYSAPTGFVAGILSSHFIGDGHSRLEYNNFSLRLTTFTSSSFLATGLSFLLLKLGIPYNITRRCRGFNIKISGEEGVERFDRCCGTSFICKKNLKFIRKKINHPSKHSVYPPFLDVNKLKFLKNKNIRNNLYRAIRLKQGLNKKLALLAANDLLLKVIKSNAFPIQIKKIEELDYNGYFYDIETKKYNNFLHGGGVFTHNCLDLDSKNLEFSKFTAELIIEALKFHDITCYSLKFSGNHGFHIAIPFEAFPKEVNGIGIKNYFPDGVRVISEYLKDMIKDFLTAKILQCGNIEKIANSVGKKKEELLVNGKFDPFKAVDIDSVLISSRHLFRCAFSINEKSGLVSIPIKDIKDFNIEDARLENVKVNLKYLDLENVKAGEARQLLLQAFDWARKTSMVEAKKIDKVFEIPKTAIKPDYFPPCILKLMSGVKEDGRKRAIFILVNFLLNVGWKIEEIEAFLLEWNKKNYGPLREGYIKAQTSWFKKQNKNVLPPNCDNQSYYSSMGIKCEEGICSKSKNPVNYTMRMVRMNVKNK